MNLAILGPQGSGKGTQAQRLADNYQLLRLETGKILREMAESDGPDAEEIKKTMLDGKLVSDDTLRKIIEERIESNSGSGIIFDGTPRNLIQYELIKNILKKRGENLDRVIYLEIPEETTIERLSTRRTCEKCNRIYNLHTNPPPTLEKCECGGNLRQRSDDTPEAIAKRLNEYRQATVPVLVSAKAEGKLVEINGTKSINEVYDEITKRLNFN